MKIHGVSGTEFSRLVIPSGTTLPKNPAIGEVFRLTQDMPHTNTVTPWYPAGLYVYNYGLWERMNDSGRQRKGTVIGSQVQEVEEPIKNKLLPPKWNEGFAISDTLVLKPTNRKASFAGHASFWVESDTDCHVLAAVFRDKTMVGMTAETLEKGKPRTMSISFYDLPFTMFTDYLPAHALANYTLRVNADKVGMLYINRGQDQFVYDEVAVQTSFFVHENT